MKVARKTSRIDHDIQVTWQGKFPHPHTRLRDIRAGDQPPPPPHPQTSDLGPTPLLLVTSGGDHRKPVKTCSFVIWGPTPKQHLVVATETEARKVSKHIGMLSCVILFYIFVVKCVIRESNLCSLQVHYV